MLAALNKSSIGQANCGGHPAAVQPGGQQSPAVQPGGQQTPPVRTSRRTTAHDNPGYFVDQTGFFIRLIQKTTHFLPVRTTSSHK